MSCVFCTDVHAAGELVFEDARTWVVVHPDWSPRGHVMVVSKQHVENASALEEEHWQHLASVWHRVEKVVLAATGAERAVMLKLGIQTPHLHLHLYPVAQSATRTEVFAAIEGRSGEPADPSFVATLRELFT